MSIPGWIYILINPSMNGLVKIGLTTRDPSGRAQELSGATGVPTPFIVVYQAYVSDCDAAEKHAHTNLETKGMRVAPNREFFEAPVHDAVMAVSSAVAEFPAIEKAGEAAPANIPSNETPPWQALYDLGMAYENGTGDCFQDYDKARAYYEKAVALGSDFACMRLGAMNELGIGGPERIDLAIMWYQKATNLGCGYPAWSSIAKAYHRQGHLQNAVKAWQNYYSDPNLFVHADLVEKAKTNLVQNAFYYWRIFTRNATGAKNVKA